MSLSCTRCSRPRRTRSRTGRTSTGSRATPRRTAARSPTAIPTRARGTWSTSRTWARPVSTSSGRAIWACARSDTGAGGVRDLLIGDVFANAARAVPDRGAAVLGDATVTFGELDGRANRMARVLIRSGVECGTRVAVWSGTNLDVVTLFAAAAKVGAVFVPVNALLQAGEAAEVIGRARPALLL